MKQNKFFKYILLALLMVAPLSSMQFVAVKSIELLDAAAEMALVAMAATYAYFKHSERPELYKIEYKAGKCVDELHTSKITEQQVQQKLEHHARISLDRVAGTISAFKKTPDTQVENTQTLPVRGTFDWKKVLEESTGRQHNYAQLTPEAIVEEITKPIFTISNQRPTIISSNYFEQFRIPSIAESINCTYSINGQPIQKTCNPQNRLFFNANVVTEQPVHYQQAIIEEFHQQISAIARNQSLSSSFANESHQLRKIFGNLHSKNRLLIAHSLDELFDANNFKTIKSVTYYQRQLDQFTKKMQQIFLMGDGSMRGGWVVGCEADITHAFAHFLIHPGANTLEDLLGATQHLHSNNIPGAHEACNRVHHELTKSIGQSLVDNFSAAVDFIDGTSRPADLSAEYQANPVNKDIKKMLDACNQNKWHEAWQIARAYEHVFLNNRDNQAARNAFYATKNLLQERAQMADVYARYSADPYFAQVFKADKENLCTHLPLLEQRLEIKKYLLKMLAVKNPSVAVDRICYELVPHFFDPKAISHCLSFLSADHADAQIRELYHIFHDANGIAKVLHYDISNLQGLKVPSCIGNQKHAQARKLLNVLVKVNTPDQKAKDTVKQAMRYAINSCIHEPLQVYYEVLGDAMSKAITIPTEDKTILLCGDFTTLNHTQEQQQLQAAIVPMSAKITQTLQNQKHITFDFKINLKTSLHGMSQMANASQNGRSDVAKELYNKGIDPMIDALSRQDPSFEPYKIYIRSICLFDNKKDQFILEEGEAQAPGKPTEKDGYIPPKKWDGKKVKVQTGKLKGKYGYPDINGRIWVPTGSEKYPSAHGGSHWDVQYPDGKTYDNIYPGGKVRHGKK